MRWIKEMGLTMGQSLKMLLAGRQTVILLVLSLVLLAAMLVSMEEVKEEKSKIAIGMVDEDNSELSAAVMAGMKQMDMYEITLGDEEELLEQLQAEELSAVCVIKKGFAKNIGKGKTNRLINLYEIENGGALLLGDIMAGVMMQEICTAKSYQTLLSYGKKAGKEITISSGEYRTYVETLLKEGDAEFSFDITYVSSNGKAAQKPAQSIIYEQAILAVFALMDGFIAIYAVLPFRQMRYGRLAERIKTLPVNRGAMYMGSALAGMLLPMTFGGVFLLCLLWKGIIDFSQIISLLVCTAAYICVIVGMMLFTAYIIKNHTVYQMGMLAMILVFGVFGLVSLLEGLLVPEGMADWVPNGWYVRKMTELLHQ